VQLLIVDPVEVGDLVHERHVDLILEVIEILGENFVPAPGYHPPRVRLSAFPDAEALDPEAAKALEALQGEVAAPEAPPPMNLDWMYQDGATAGAEDAKIAAGYGIHALAGLATGLVCGPCGCIGAPAVELLVSPGVPAGVWQGYDSTYQRGYIDSYRRTTRQRRAVYAAVGATVGATATFAAGLAFSIYGDLL
jgi:hypothetical protein